MSESADEQRSSRSASAERLQACNLCFLGTDKKKTRHLYRRSINTVPKEESSTFAHGSIQFSALVLFELELKQLNIPLFYTSEGLCTIQFECVNIQNENVLFTFRGRRLHFSFVVYDLRYSCEIKGFFFSIIAIR